MYQSYGQYSIVGNPRCWLRLVVLVSTIAVILHGNINAQPEIDTAGRWRTIDPGLHSDFPRNDLSAEAPFFQDSLVGYHYPYRTTDGGSTWEEWMTGYGAGFPFTMINDSIGVNRSGYMTYDGARSWKRLTFPRSDSIRPNGDGAIYIARKSAAYPPSTIVVLYQLYLYPLNGAGWSSWGGVPRLAISTDAGTTWRMADSLIDDSTTAYESIQDTTIFGALPRPDGENDIGTEWELADITFQPFPIMQIWSWAGNINGRWSYMGRLHLENQTAEWITFPFSGSSPSPQYVSPTEGYLRVQSAYMRTLDGGRTWDSLNIPDWVDFKQQGPITFVSPGFGFATNAITHDSGKTWQRSGNPFLRRMFALDSTHFYVAGPHSLFARTSDAGRTWKHTLCGAIPYSIATHGSRVLIGRNHQSLLVSADSGETWREIGLEGGLPKDISIIHALGFPDTTNNPDRVIGAATFSGAETGGYLAVIESSDGGITWRVGDPLITIDNLAMQAEGRIKEIPVTMSLVHEGGETTVFVAMDTSLFVRNGDSGPWKRYSTAKRIITLVMADRLNGVSAMAPDRNSYVHLMYTTDGGISWQGTPQWAYQATLGLTALSRSIYRAIQFEVRKDTTQWSVLKSIDSGRTWTMESHIGTEPLIGNPIWLDTSRVYIVGDGGRVHYSRDGGASFTLLHDSIAGFRFLQNLYNNKPWPTGANTRYLFVNGEGNALGRFTMVEDSTPVATSSVAANASSTISPSDIRIDISAGSLSVEYTISASADAEISLADILGETLLHHNMRYLSPGTQHATINVSSLPSGKYFIRIRVGSHVETFPCTLLRPGR